MHARAAHAKSEPATSDESGEHIAAAIAQALERIGEIRTETTLGAAPRL